MNHPITQTASARSLSDMSASRSVRHLSRDLPPNSPIFPSAGKAAGKTVGISTSESDAENMEPQPKRQCTTATKIGGHTALADITTIAGPARAGLRTVFPAFSPSESVITSPHPSNADIKVVATVESMHNNDSQQSTSTQQTHQPKKKMSRGQSVRVYYDAGDDVFGKDRKGGAGYFFGMVVDLPKGRGDDQYSVLFEDNQVLPIPADDCEVWDWRSHVGPLDLEVGDQVFGFYQNGESENSDAWFRGRVGAVCDGNKTCDIAYDDADWECSVPITHSTIHLVDKGKRNQLWLDGLKVKLAENGDTRETNATLKMIPTDASQDCNDDMHPPMVEVHFRSGRVEKRRYSEIVEMLFREVKKRANVIQWKTSMKVHHAGTKAALKIPPSDVAEGTANEFALDDWLSDSEDDLHDGQDGYFLSQMPHSLANSFWNALNYADGHVGADLLIKTTGVHNFAPNKDICQNLIAILTEGPKAGSVHFPDSVRMGLAQDYWEVLKAKPGMCDRIAELSGPEFWIECLDEIAFPWNIYCVEKDETRSTKGALTRVGQSLSVKASGASLLCDLLQHATKEYCRERNAGNLKKAQMKKLEQLLRSKPLIRSIFLSKGGPSGALKKSVEAASSILINYGHFLSGDFQLPAPDATKRDCESSAPAAAEALDVEFVAEEVRRLVDLLGKICGFLAVLHSIDEGKPLSACSDLIKSAISGAFDRTEFDPSSFLAGKSGNKKHWLEMKVVFVMSLHHKQVVGHLARRVAQLLKVDKNGKHLC